MAASLVYLLLRQVLQMLTQLARDGGAKEIELLVPGHQVAVLRRRVHRPDLEPATATGPELWPANGLIDLVGVRALANLASSPTVDHERLDLLRGAVDRALAEPVLRRRRCTRPAA